MTTSNFQQWPEAEQSHFIGENGAYLGRRKHGFYTIELYQVESFYTEIFYHSHFNVLIKIESFSDLERLEPYLKKISLRGLFKS